MISRNTAYLQSYNLIQISPVWRLVRLVTSMQISASLNHRKKVIAEPSRLIPRKLRQQTYSFKWGVQHLHFIILEVITKTWPGFEI